MFKFIGKALTSLVLTDDAKQALGKQMQAAAKVRAKGAPGRAGAPGGAPAPVPGSREAQIAEVQAKMKGVVTPDRSELIRQAMEVCRAKQAILADLDDETRQKLVALALKKLLAKVPEE